MNSTTTTMPATIRELVALADERGVKPSDLLPELMPPASFTMDEPGFMAGDYRTWSGPSFEGNGWKVTSHWTIEEGVTF